MRRVFRKQRKPVPTLEPVPAVAIMLLCGELTKWQVQFRLIDFRPLMIVATGTMHGLNMELLSAAAFEQRALYCKNLFRILCRLISSSLSHAMDHQQAKLETDSNILLKIEKGDTWL